MDYVRLTLYGTKATMPVFVSSICKLERSAHGGTTIYVRNIPYGQALMDAAESLEEVAQLIAKPYKYA